MTGQGDPRVAYCSEEDVREALDIAPSGSARRRIARAILASSTSIEGLLNRRFYPQIDTRYFDWPLNGQYAPPWRLWLDNHEALSVSSIITGGRTLLPGTHFILRPENTGPPYSHIEILLSSGAALGATGTWQQAVQVNGTFGGCDDTDPAGQLTAAIPDTTSTPVQVSDSAAVGTLDTILIGTEWMTVTAKTLTTSGATLAADLTASKGGTAVTVSGGTWHEGESILVGAERMRVTDVAGSTLIVQRATDGTVLATHTSGAAIYVPRQLAVQRGVLGSTAATHPNSAAVQHLTPPERVRDLAIAQAAVTLQQHSAGWQTSRGTEARITDQRSLDDLRDEAYTRWARQSRIRAV